MASSREHVLLLKQDQPSYSNEDLTFENALILDQLEEYEERLSRIEKCLLDLCFALRVFVTAKDFSTLKKQFEKENATKCVKNDSPAQGSEAGRAARRRAPDKEVRPVLRGDSNETLRKMKR